MNKIYIFRNFVGPAQQWNQFAAIAEDGYALATQMLKPEEMISYRFKFGDNGPHVKKYKNYYPNGYELVFIDDIGAPENKDLRDKLQSLTWQRENQAKVTKKIEKMIKEKLDDALKPENIIDKAIGLS